MGFSTSLSGLYANQQKLNVIGNNLANLNTIGFKASTVQFMDLVSQSVGGTSMNPMQVGLGVTTGSISPNFRQGGVETTGIATNVAIQGDGFFVIGGPASRSYTRAGDFTFDANGTLVTPDGQPVLGYTTIDAATGRVDTTGTPGEIVLPPGVLRPPVVTTLFGTTTNLDAGADVGATFSSAVQIYDSLGQPHVATITYTKTGAGAWGYDITVPGDEITGGTAGTPFSIGNGTLAFDAQGRLSQVNGGGIADVVIAGPAWANGAAPTPFTWDLVDANGVASLTGFGSPSATSSSTQNGSAAGSVTAIGINSGGEILATFGTGATIVVGQLAVANFNNPQGLTKLGSNRFGESAASGLASIGIAGTGGRGSLTGGAVEQSNVDIAQEFTQMILAQRGYQANSKSITVTDELLLETLNLKR
ncbi:MAG: flagellar hook protein FlgE [Acidobacteria bacterium]|nr:flagellar hook protein FlgE [Acidobacteriota bacterium]